MKFTSKQLIEAIGLKEEDVVFCQGKKYIVKDNKLICKDEQDGIGLEIILGVDYLLDKDFEIAKPKKKVGDLICEETKCRHCPINAVCRYLNKRYSLYEALDRINTEYDIDLYDKEIYDILKARLDKEVEE